MSGLDSMPRAPLCGPDAPDNARDRCTGWKQRPPSELRCSSWTCEGSRDVAGVLTICSHDCHTMSDPSRRLAFPAVV